MKTTLRENCKEGGGGPEWKRFVETFARQNAKQCG